MHESVVNKHKIWTLISVSIGKGSPKNTLMTNLGGMGPQSIVQQLMKMFL